MALDDGRVEKDRLLIEQHETAAGKTSHRDVFFSDSGEVMLMSKPKADTAMSIDMESKDTSDFMHITVIVTYKGMVLPAWWTLGYPLQWKIWMLY